MARRKPVPPPPTAQLLWSPLWLYANVVARPDLHPRTKLVLLFVATFAVGGVYTGSIRHIGRGTGLSRKGVMTALDQLHDLGLVEVSRVRGHVGRKIAPVTVTMRRDVVYSAPQPSRSAEEESA